MTTSNLSKENIVKHLQDILDENRKDTAQMKIRLQQELEDLQKRQRNDSKQLHELDSKCNQLLIQNRNLKFEYDRTVSEHQQLERDQQHQIRVHEDKLRQANKQLLDLQAKYQEIQERMTKEHQVKLKEIAREWESRLRNVEEKIRMTENQNNVLDSEIRKNMEKKERLKVEYMDQEQIVRSRIEEEQTQRYSFKVTSLQSKLREIEQSREQFIKRNQDLLYQLQKSESSNTKNIIDLEQELNDLKNKQDQFVKKNKDFISRNQKLKSDINLKQINIEQLQEEINRLNSQIEVKKGYNRDQIDKIVQDAEYQRTKREQQKQNQINRLNGLEAQLRNSQLENAKLRQEYAILAQKLQVGLGKAVQEVFTENSLY